MVELVANGSGVEAAAAAVVVGFGSTDTVTAVDALMLIPDGVDTVEVELVLGDIGVLVGDEAAVVVAFDMSTGMQPIRRGEVALVKFEPVAQIDPL